MLKYRQWKVSPLLIGAAGSASDTIRITGKLFLNDNNDVLIEDPIQDNILVFNEVTQGEYNPRWLNQDLTSTITPIVQTIINNQSPGSNSALICDEVRMYAGDVNLNFNTVTGVSTGNDPNLDGWFLCNGQNGTQNLQSKFVLGLGPGQYTDTVGITGGVSEVTLTGAESGTSSHQHSANSADGSSINIASSGSHAHAGRSDNSGTGSGDVHVKFTTGTIYSNAVQPASHTHGTGSFQGSTAPSAEADAAEAHTNIPPYIILAFIQYKCVVEESPGPR